MSVDFTPLSPLICHLQKMFGVCVHPRFGGWFAIRALLVFGGVTVDSEMLQPDPPDCVPSREGRIQLLEAFNLHWQVHVHGLSRVGRTVHTLIMIM